MKRNLYNELLAWKNSPDRKPLLLQGARQTGKTWLMKEFGKNEYNRVIYLNFEKKPGLSSYFEKDLSPIQIIKGLEYHFDTVINQGDTLIIMDEIQESPRALNSLKYFYEDAPQYHIITAGSFLGVAMYGSFPVGKVDRLTLYPLSFYEFLDGIGKERYVQAIKNLDLSLIRAISGDYEKLLKTYFLTGGMPKAVAAFAERENFKEVRTIQNGILADYTDDFSKHIFPLNTAKVKMIWNSLPRHLSKEKKKFVYKELTDGARAYSYEDAMNWLFDTRLVYKVPRTETDKLPLSSYADERIFKLFMLDVGLFCAKSELDIAALFEPNDDLYGIFNGAITEQYVMQELRTAGYSPYYWGRDKGEAEVDFVVQWRNEIVPIEVKAGIRKKSKSLDVYRQICNPKYAVRTTFNNFGTADTLHSIPLYMIASFGEILSMSSKDSA
ncbi:MAG: AAA family ATPase [Treponema sp.]|jgi:predicted AAA+ superfamily ATPase|nr:AAA family ATPase [Treponema sp.]